MFITLEIFSIVFLTIFPCVCSWTMEFTQRPLSLVFVAVLVLHFAISVREEWVVVGKAGVFAIVFVSYLRVFVWEAVKADLFNVAFGRKSQNSWYRNCMHLANILLPHSLEHKLPFLTHQNSLPTWLPTLKLPLINHPPIQ